MASNPTITIPVDIAGTVFMAAGTPVPKLADRETGELKTDREGRTLYEVSVLKRDPSATRAELIAVTVAGEPAGVDMGVPLHITGLVAYVWGMNDRDGNLRYGVSFRAESVTAGTTKAVA
jgi:hypothetical protein